MHLKFKNNNRVVNYFVNLKEVIAASIRVDDDIENSSAFAEVALDLKFLNGAHEKIYINKKEDVDIEALINEINKYF